MKEKSSPGWAIEELEKFLAGKTLPAGPVQLSQATTIIDVPLFVSSHLSAIKAHNGNKTYYPYFERLLNFSLLLISK